MRVAFARGKVLTVIQTNARGVRMGTSSPTHRFTDAQVEYARELRAAGATVKAVAEVIGCNPSTAWRWAVGHRRRPPEAVRVILRPPINTPPCAVGGRPSATAGFRFRAAKTTPTPTLSTAVGTCKKGCGCLHLFDKRTQKGGRAYPQLRCRQPSGSCSTHSISFLRMSSVGRLCQRYSLVIACSAGGGCRCRPERLVAGAVWSASLRATQRNTPMS
jgi:hypothetical protein